MTRKDKIWHKEKRNGERHLQKIFQKSGSEWNWEKGLQLGRK
jgi:hypothetical protein